MNTVTRPGWRTSATINDDGVVQWVSHMMIDDDGSDNRWHDPDWQPDTSLHYNGRPVDAGKVPYVVVPPAIINAVVPTVLGCQAQVTHKNVTVDAVVADIGPRMKIGEGSVELARRLGIPESPVSGGDETYDVLYKIFPGIPAVVDEVTYNLQPTHVLG